MPPSRRDDLIDAAIRVFNREGFHCVGIDRLLTEAGVAKMTLYNHFKGKEDLIAAALQRKSDEEIGRLRERLRAFGADDPRERALAYFDAVGELFVDKDFAGCLFLNAAAEYKDCEHPVRRVVTTHAQRLVDLIEGLLRDAGVEDARALADQWFILAEGAVEVAKVTRDPSAAQRAKAAARSILEAHASAKPA